MQIPYEVREEIEDWLIEPYDETKVTLTDPSTNQWCYIVDENKYIYYENPEPTWVNEITGEGSLKSDLVDFRDLNQDIFEDAANTFSDGPYSFIRNYSIQDVKQLTCELYFEGL